MVVHGRIEVPLQVGPPVDGIAVTECSVELDQGALAAVADVAVHHPAGRVLTELSLAFGKTVGPLDVAQVALLEHRPGAGADVVEDFAQQCPPRQAGQSVDNLDESFGGGEALMDRVGQQCDGVHSVRSPAALSSA